MRQIILASRSPARRQILKDAGLKIGVAYADIDESRLPRESVEHYAIRVAHAKAKKVATKYPGVHRSPIVIGVDTVIAIGAHILGKPKNIAQARAFLKRLSGRWHKVYTGTVVIDAGTGRALKKLIVSRVKFARLSPAQISWYIKTGEPMHAAGAYSIQGRGRALIESVDGCLTNIIGISIPALMKMLKVITVRARQ